MHIVVTFRDRGLADYANRLDQLGGRMGFLAQALNEGGHALRSQTVAAETAQTGLPEDTLERAQRETLAGGGSLTYTITSAGGNVRAKFFNPSEGGGGATAHPWNRATFYPGGFLTSGRPGNRRIVIKGGPYENIERGEWGGKIRAIKTGLFIPTEMTKGKTAATFESGSAIVLKTVVTRLGSLLP